MALTPFQKGELAISVSAMISHAGGSLKVDANNLTQRLIRTTNQDNRQNYQVYRNIVNQSIRLASAAEDLQGGLTIQGNRLPTDPSISPSDPRYKYRVLVAIVDAKGNTVSKIPVVITSNSILTLIDIESAAEESVRNMVPVTSSGRDAKAPGNSVDFTKMTVLTVGERST